MKLYSDLADWWPLLSNPGDYREEAGLYWKIISRYKNNVSRALELGSGGGNNAFHLKRYCEFTLTDLSPEMISISRKLNPECHHEVADMRDIDLQEKFDLVFIHDAVMYLTTHQDLERVFQAARRHLHSDGILFITPDFFRETYEPSTGHGGGDAGNRSLRYLEWTYDPDPGDSTVVTEYVYLMKENGGAVRVEHEQMTEGIFSLKEWEDHLVQSGFSEVSIEPIEHSELPKRSYYGIIARPG